MATDISDKSNEGSRHGECLYTLEDHRDGDYLLIEKEHLNLEYDVDHGYLRMHFSGYEPECTHDDCAEVFNGGKMMLSVLITNVIIEVKDKEDETFDNSTSITNRHRYSETVIKLLWYSIISKYLNKTRVMIMDGYTYIDENNIVANDLRILADEVEL